MSSKKPLHGYTVIDFSAVFAGPICTRMLLDCGADVIKIEAPGAGDYVRGVEGLTRVFAHFNAGKRCIAIDLKNPEGQQLARRLIATADVVIENFRPGIMAKFGLDYASLKLDRPDLVYCSISGFGQSGPQVNRAAYAPIVHAASGFDSVHTRAQTGANEQASQRPPNWEIMIADILTGTYAFGAIQTALLGRERHGSGDYIDVSMMESMMSLIPAHIQRAQASEPVAIGRFCPVKTSDGYVMICIVSDKTMENLCAAIERPDLLQDPRFIRGPRTTNLKLLAAEIELWSATRTANECEVALNQSEVPCSAYQQPEDLFDHPQVLERGSFTNVSDNRLGDFLIQNLPFKLRNADITASGWVAKLGEHTDEVLGDRLGLTPTEIAVLRSARVIFSA